MVELHGADGVAPQPPPLLDDPNDAEDAFEADVPRVGPPGRINPAQRLARCLAARGGAMGRFLAPGSESSTPAAPQIERTRRRGRPSRSGMMIPRSHWTSRALIDLELARLPR